MNPHTPGPWRTNGYLVEGPKMALQVAIAYAPKLGNAPRTVDEAKANARLIAAAPDLLAALEQMLANAKADRWSGFMLGAAESAIAKAKGEQS